MKEIKIIILCVSVAVLASCAPSVVTDMLTNEYTAVSKDSVRVFLPNERVPAKSLAIGSVKVVDKGFAVGGSYERVLGMAVEATAKNGGNGLVITEHRYPDMRSTIHRVWGTMLRLPDTISATTANSSVSRALAISENSELGQGYISPTEEIKRINENAPRNILRFNVGPSWLTSKYQIGNHLYNSKCGVDVEVDYNHVWKYGFGIGVNYLHNYTSFDEGLSMHLNYIGPSLVIAVPFNKSRWDAAIGLGYCNYMEKVDDQSYSESRIAPMMRWGWEYRVGKQIALGLQMNMISVKLKKPDGVVLKKNEFYGIRRYGIHIGMRYYF